MLPTRLRGARTHNLQGIDLDLEPGQLVVVAGPSGSGKSSLALSTLYAEGQRRYVESFSAYARQFLERLPRPPVDSLEPVPAGVAVDRQGPVRTSRSTVASMTEIADYAKSLWAQCATLFSPATGKPVARDTPGSAAQQLIDGATDAPRVTVTYPVTVTDTESFLTVREQLLADGYRRVWIGGDAKDLDTLRPSDVQVRKGGKKPRTIDVVADRTRASADHRSRLVEALEAAMRRGEGAATAHMGNVPHPFTTDLSCPVSGQVFRDATPGLFSFNSPVGACDTCRGFGRIIAIDYDKVLPDLTKSVANGAIASWSGPSTAWERRELKKFARRDDFPMDKPIGRLTEEQLAWLIEGDGEGWPNGWWGLSGWFEWLETRVYKMHVRVLLSRYRKYDTCPDCEGARLKPESLWWKVDGRTIADFFAMPVTEARSFLAEVRSTLVESDAASRLLVDECASRLALLEDVGLGYLSLDRASRTLSGGEAQRVALTSALGASLTGALFVLDEPTVGLHPGDVERLSHVVRRLSDAGNTCVVVEHERQLLTTADRIVELGHGAGEKGGNLVFDGTPNALARAKTATGRWLRGESELPWTEPRPLPPRSSAKGWLTLSGATGHNLRGDAIAIPLGVLTCITGVSGSGKSSLIVDTLVPALQRRRGQPVAQAPLPHEDISGHEAITEINLVDQSPLGRTSRGNPATYMKAWDVFRKRFAAERVAQDHDLGPGAFSFNVAGGRCEVCKGQGFETVEMQFLADVSFPCVACRGLRFVGPVLEVRHCDRSVADVLDMTVDAALEHFRGDHGRAVVSDDWELVRTLSPLSQVGLGYLRLGQPLNTLSGGEAQRLKLAATLAKTKRRSLIVLDEPTAGLHADDIGPLFRALSTLVSKGVTVVVIEHDMDIAARSDYVIDIGPGAGATGGNVVAAGTPGKVAESTTSPTARYLSDVLARRHALPKAPRASKKRAPRGDGGMQIVGAREHNLTNVSVTIPQNQLVVVTGPSGSGKSSLAFDVLFAEGQRRYLETLSPYARQYLPQMPRPDVDRVIGIPPTVALEQRMTRGAGTSTVATVTEIAHFLRLLYARVGRASGEEGGRGAGMQDASVTAALVRRKFGERARVFVTAPVIQGRKGFHRDVLDKALADGVIKARIDGSWVDLKEGMSLSRFDEHDIDLLIAKVKVRERQLLVGAIEAAAALGNGDVRIVHRRGELMTSLSSGAASGPRLVLDPRVFSFNTRQGACPRCEGRGVIEPPKKKGRRAKTDTGPPRICSACGGTRLSTFARSVLVDGKPITHWLHRSVDDVAQQLPALTDAFINERDRALGEPLIGELSRRLELLCRLGLGYLGLGRAADTLSGGETQRVRLAAQLGSGLTGVLYVLDEPTIGLHPRDTRRLIEAMRQLVEVGNSVVVVEHDADTIRAADRVIDMGPGGGHRGGRLLFEGTPVELAASETSVTGPALRAPARRSDATHPGKDADWLTLRGAAEHNLQHVDISIPLSRLVVVTGVSGSGKSTLVRGVLLPAVRQELGLVTEPPGAFSGIEGASPLKRAVMVDQSPIGRTPRSVPATYVGIWDEIRALLAGVPEARARGYAKSRFSFNTAGGRCSLCDGNGAIVAEMSFLPDVHMPCEACRGLRFDRDTLSVRYREKNAGEILQLEVEEAAELFDAVPKIARPLRLLTELGLGYLKLGQPSNTLSGGEAQRLKLVAELATGASGPTLYVLDEPTTGLHRSDVERLLVLLHRFVERGDTVVVIEHNPDVIGSAGWVVDLGPEGGAGGGTIVVSGTPEDVAAHKTSHTGAVLRAEWRQNETSAPRKKRATRK